MHIAAVIATTKFCYHKDADDNEMNKKSAESSKRQFIGDGDESMCSGANVNSSPTKSPI